MPLFYSFDALSHFGSVVFISQTNTSSSSSHSDDDPSKLRKSAHFKDPLPFSTQGAFFFPLDLHISLKFNVVPIFDGRDGIHGPFRCRPWQLSQIGQCVYPQYKDSSVDLPAGSTVAVGYTAHTYKTSASTYLSLSLQFLVLLSLPSSPPLSLNTVSSSIPASSSSTSHHTMTATPFDSHPFDADGNLHDDCVWLDDSAH